MKKLSGDPRQEKIHEDRYAHKKTDGSLETVSDVFRRVAKASSLPNEGFGWSQRVQEEKFYTSMIEDRFTPAGRPLSNLGPDGNNMCFNCFVLPIEDSRVGIIKTLGETTEIASLGGGIGTNFSPLRPYGAEVKGTNAVASGPVSFIDVFQAMAATIKQGGTRGLACMSVLNVYHPDIMKFIDAKSKDLTRWPNTNVSVGMSDDFMDAVLADADWDLTFNGVVYKTVKAKYLFRYIAQAAWESGEPGVLFLDTLIRGNLAPQLGEIVATNPCGEQPLLPYAACDLGALILPTFWDKKGGTFKWSLLKRTIYEAVLWLDNLITISTYPLGENERIAKLMRPIGVGAMGWADLLLLAGLPYGNHPETLEFVKKVSRFIYDTSKKASEELGKDLGYCEIDLKGQDPRRNATLTSYAPTGTIAPYFQCSYGVEPYFALRIKCNEEIGCLETGNHWLDAYMEEHKLKELPSHVRFSLGGEGIPEEMVLTVDDHIAMLHAVAVNCDTGVSKTLNLPASATVEDVEDAYLALWRLGIKGGTVFRDGSRKGAFEVVGAEKEDEITDCEEYDIEFINHTEAPKQRPVELSGVTYRIKPDPERPSLYIQINDLEEEPFEIFFTTRDARLQESLDLLAQSLTTNFRRGEFCQHLVEDFLTIESASGGGRYKNRFIASLGAGIAMVMKDHYRSLGLFPEKPESPEFDTPVAELQRISASRCPKCGERALVSISGCYTCLECPYSACS